jgi:hypothetical protein
VIGCFGSVQIGSRRCVLIRAGWSSILDLAGAVQCPAAGIVPASDQFRISTGVEIILDGGGAVRCRRLYPDAISPRASDRSGMRPHDPQIEESESVLLTTWG